MPFRKNVFILGAGFSADAGAPVMYDFLPRADTLRRDPRSGMPQEQRDVFDNVFDFLHERWTVPVRINLDLENIEHLFGVAEMFLNFSGASRFGFRDSLLGMIVQTLERSIGSRLTTWRWTPTVRASDRTVAVNMDDLHYGQIFAGIVSRKWFSDFGISSDGGSPDTIITFNYDCFVDDCLVKLRVRPDYYLPTEDIPADWNSLQSRVAVLKLHGSTNWLRCTSQTCQRRIWVSPGSSAERQNYLPGRTRCPRCGEPQVEPVIIPPTWTKSEYREAIIPVWTQAVKALREADRIFIIGYSMPAGDTFFQYLMALGLTNPDLDSVTIINPNADVHSAFTQLFPEPFRSRRVLSHPRIALRTAESFVRNELLSSLGRQFVDREGIEASGIHVPI